MTALATIGDAFSIFAKRYCFAKAIYDSDMVTIGWKVKRSACRDQHFLTPFDLFQYELR
jgi:hypothetical protein